MVGKWNILKEKQKNKTKQNKKKNKQTKKKKTLPTCET